MLIITCKNAISSLYSHLTWKFSLCNEDHFLWSTCFWSPSMCEILLSSLNAYSSLRIYHSFPYPFCSFLLLSNCLACLLLWPLITQIWLHMWPEMSNDKKWIGHRTCNFASKLYFLGYSHQMNHFWQCFPSSLNELIMLILITSMTAT